MRKIARKVRATKQKIDQARGHWDGTLYHSLMAEKKYKQAEAYCAKAVKTDPANVEAQLGRAIAIIKWYYSCENRKTFWNDVDFSLIVVYRALSQSNNYTKYKDIINRLFLDYYYIKGSVLYFGCLSADQGLTTSLSQESYYQRLIEILRNFSTVIDKFNEIKELSPLSVNDLDFIAHIYFIIAQLKLIYLEVHTKKCLSVKNLEEGFNSVFSNLRDCHKYSTAAIARNKKNFITNNISYNAYSRLIPIAFVFGHPEKAQEYIGIIDNLLAVAANKGCKSDLLQRVKDRQDSFPLSTSSLLWQQKKLVTGQLMEYDSESIKLTDVNTDCARTSIETLSTYLPLVCQRLSKITKKGKVDQARKKRYISDCVREAKRCYQQDHFQQALQHCEKYLTKQQFFCNFQSSSTSPLIVFIHF